VPQDKLTDPGDILWWIIQNWDWLIKKHKDEEAINKWINSDPYKRDYETARLICASNAETWRRLKELIN